MNFEVSRLASCSFLLLVWRRVFPCMLWDGSQCVAFFCMLERVNPSNDGVLVVAIDVIVGFIFKDEVYVMCRVVGL